MATGVGAGIGSAVGSGVSVFADSGFGVVTSAETFDVLSTTLLVLSSNEQPLNKQTTEKIAANAFRYRFIFRRPP
jgi:hypothetical protein